MYDPFDNFVIQPVVVECNNQTLTVKTSGTLYWKVAQGGRKGSITTLTANVASGTKVSSGKTITFSASGGAHTCSAAVVWVNP